nr:MAG TPA: hypothetical protein [Caudoviricetes sp.]DAQ66903.1 MAG TPA: hypothetical protein [Caudoviricetes sp.]
MGSFKRTKIQRRSRHGTGTYRRSEGKSRRLHHQP